MRKEMMLVGLLAACGGGSQTASTGPAVPGATGGGGAANVCGASQAEEGVRGLWRFDSAVCGQEAVEMEAPAFEEEIEVSIAWPAYTTIAHTLVRRRDALCRYRVDRRIEPGGAPQRVVETGRWAEIAGPTGWTPATPEDCPAAPEAVLDGELRLEAETLLLTLQSPSFCPGKPWVFRYRRIPCAAH